MMLSRGTITVFMSCLALVASLPLGCRIERLPSPAQGWRVVPDEGDPPGSGGIYREHTINGKCYLTNGTWCIPCSGGEYRLCNEILRQPSVEFVGSGPFNGSVSDPVDIVDDDGSGGSTEYENQFFELTGGLGGPVFQILWGWNLWADGDEVEGPLIVNLYTDEGHVDDAGNFHQEWLDVSFLWRGDWQQLGVDGELPPAVTMGAYLNGNLADDDPADLMLLRVGGPAADVQTLLETLAAPGTDFQVTLPNGFTWPLP